MRSFNASTQWNAFREALDARITELSAEIWVAEVVAETEKGGRRKHRATSYFGGVNFSWTEGSPGISRSGDSYYLQSH